LHQVIHQARFSALSKALNKSYQLFIREMVVRLCKDALENKHNEAKNLRLRLRKFEKEEEARKKRELEEGLRRLEARELKLKKDQKILRA
jgi:rRNA-processing protein FCF1